MGNSTLEYFGANLKEKPRPASLVALNPSGTRTPLFFMPGRSSLAWDFIDLATSLGEDQPFFSFHSHDLPGEKFPWKSLEEVAAIQLEQVRSLQPEGPYYLGGVCMGCLVAFEMAHQLIAQKEKVELLILMEPSLIPFQPRGFKIQFDRYRYHLWELFHLNPLQQIHYLSNRVGNIKKRVLPGTETDSHEKQQISLTVARAYKFRPYPDRAVIILAKDAFFRLRPQHDPRLKWRKFFLQKMDIYEIPGDHSTFLRNPNAYFLTQRLNSFFMPQSGS